MKNLSIVIAALGGIAVGAALGVLFAPNKGKDTRARIAHYLRCKGIHLPKHKMDKIVNEIEGEVAAG